VKCFLCVSVWSVREETRLELCPFVSPYPTATMKLLAKPTRVRWAAIIVASFLCGSLSSRVTRAECGDYVRIGRPLGQTKARTVDWRSSFALLDMSQQDAPMDHGTKLPCHGPSCHSRDPLPATPFAAASIVVPQWACLGLPAEMPLHGFAELTTSDWKPRAQGHGNPIYHPPRFC
jgi:hypothetical protein